MARVTYRQALAKAMADDAEFGTEHRADAVVFQMLDLIGRRARGELPQPAPRATHVELQDREMRQVLKQQQLARANRMISTRAGAAQARREGDGLGAAAKGARKSAALPLLAKSAPAGPQHPDDAKVRAAAALGGALTPEQAAAAIDAAVVQGRISGTEAMQLLKRLKVNA